MANHKEGEGLRVIREVSCVYQLNSIAAEMPKTAVSIFISELLSRSFSAQLADAALYEFLEESILMLDRAKGSISEFPLAFTLRLSQFMGLYPHNNFNSSNTNFDMLGGNFCSQPPEHAYYFSLPLSEKLSQALTASASGYEIKNPDLRSRSELLDKMLSYYRLHIPTFGEIKSVQILTEIFRD
jgi:DNA repair protein RecO (recombination protein O)